MGNNPNSFYWMSHDTPMNYTDWQPGEPNAMASNENCLELREQFEYRWNDNWCDFANYFVCEGVKTLGMLIIHLSHNSKCYCMIHSVSITIVALPGQQSLHDFISLRSA